MCNCVPKHVLLGGGILWLGVIFYIAGLDSSDWFIYEDADENATATIGLFKMCCNSSCSVLMNRDEIISMKALVMTGTILGVIAGNLAVTTLSLNSLKLPCKMMSILTCVSSFLPIVALGTSWIVFTLKREPESNVEFGDPIIFCGVGGFLVVFGGLTGSGRYLMFSLERKKSKETKKEGDKNVGEKKERGNKKKVKKIEQNKEEKKVEKRKIE